MYKLGTWIVYPDKFLITYLDEEVKLKSLSMGLLLCLIENHGNVLSKNELIDRCWNGRIVTDDAVRQAIKELRSVLGCKNDGIEYIQTIRKQGYRLVPKIEPITVKDKNLEPQTPSNLSLPLKENKFVLIAISCLVLIGCYFVANYSHIDSYSLSKKATIITYDEKREEGYDRSIEGWDAYVVLKPDFYFGEKIIVRDVNKTIMHTILPKYKNGHVGNSVFSPNGQLLAYLDYYPNNCNIRIINIKSGSQVKALQCQNSDRFIALNWHNNEELFFGTRPNDSIPSGLHSYDVKNDKKRLITNPSIGGDGDYFVRSCNKNNYFILRNNDLSTTSIINYDALTKQEKFIINIPEILTTADWLPDCKNIVLHMRGKGLYSLSTETSELSLIDESLEGVYSLLVDNENLYVAKGELFNKSIVVSETKNQRSISTLVKSNGNNIFYTKNPINETFAFISSRTGRAQVWLKQGDNLVQLTSFSYVIDEKSLAWSIDGSLIYLAEGNNIWKIKTTPFEYRKAHVSQGAVYSLVPVKNNEWLYSSYENNLWQGISWDSESNDRTTVSNLSIKGFKRNRNEKIFFRTQNDDIYEFNLNKRTNKKVTSLDADCADWMALDEVVYCVGDGALKSKKYEEDIMNIDYKKIGIGERLFVENNNKIYLEKTNSGVINIYQYQLNSH